MSSHDSAELSGVQDVPASVAVTSLEELAGCREWLATLISDCDRDRCFEVEVVASELVTNALEHGRVAVVHVEAQRVPGRLDLVVTSADHGVQGTFHPDPDVPDPSDTRGRGLVIVRALSASYRVRVEDGMRHDEVGMALDR